MVDHPTHKHWHFEATARYVLTAPADRRPIVNTDKVSFCPRDSHPLRPASGAETYGDCERDSVQGISPGWGDEYSFDLDGQALPLPTDLPDGTYRLTLTADPYDRMRESDDDNNAAIVGLRLTGTQAAVAPATGCPAPLPSQ